MSTKIWNGRRMVLALLPVLSLHVSNSIADELTREQITAELVGNTLQYQGDQETIFEFLAPDGVIHGLSTLHGPYVARWRFLDEASICFEHDDPMASGCVAVVLRKPFVEYHRKDGVVEGPVLLLTGNPRGL